MIALSVAGAVLVTVIAAWLVWLPAAAALRAIARQTPDPALPALRSIVKFSGYDPRPSLRRRRDVVSAQLQASRAELAGLNAQLARLDAAPVADVVMFHRRG